MTERLEIMVAARPSEYEARRQVERITNVRRSATEFANHGDRVQITELERQASLQHGSVSNRGLRSGLVGTLEPVAERILEFERPGLDVLLLPFFPPHEEIERLAEEVVPSIGGAG